MTNDAETKDEAVMNSNYESDLHHRSSPFHINLTCLADIFPCLSREIRGQLRCGDAGIKPQSQTPATAS